ncbi:hypothetical protein ACJMK2_016759 [Sinanodonta woodiana]|uniref:Uncharacterized protein n=1 Tax=Sinanodonta woodiana TaxID=1069815 RepID=A0ABD3UXU6_SINWO
MSDGGGMSGGALAGIAVAGVAVIMVIVGIIVYCFIASRKSNDKNSRPMRQVQKAPDIYASSASQKMDYRAPRVSKFPDPIKEKDEKNKNRGYDNPTFKRSSSDSSSVDGNSLEGGRDLSPPRPSRRGYNNPGFSSDSSFEDSSSMEENGGKVDAYSSVDFEHEQRKQPQRRSLKAATKNDIISGKDKGSTDSGSVRGGRSQRVNLDMPDSSRSQSRGGNSYPSRKPRSDSPLTMEILEKHDKTHDSSTSLSKARTESNETSTVTQTSLVTETETSGTISDRQRKFVKNASLRRNSPSRSSSHRRYKKDKEKEPSKHGSARRSHRSRSSSPSSGSVSSSQRSRRSRSADKRLAKEQAILPIFQNPHSRA